MPLSCSVTASWAPWPGAIADLLLVDGDPLSNIDLLQHQGAHLAVIMKDGNLHKCTL